MTPFRSPLDVLREVWHALTIASALRHGAPVSDRALQFCTPAPAQQAQLVA